MWYIVRTGPSEPDRTEPDWFRSVRYEAIRSGPNRTGPIRSGPNRTGPIRFRTEPVRTLILVQYYRFYYNQ